MRTEYPAKVLLAWGEAISGHAGLRDWLMKNGYPELGIFVFALRNQPEARQWLMANGHPHLMALIQGAEGVQQALDWLERNELTTLRHMALAGDEPASVRWLMAQGHRELAMIAMRIYTVKRDLDERYKDIHHYPQA
ncbi:MAG: hypothetical protein RBT71_12010 [Flavobacteriales bacterium]|jgi:hypothetical protein|nr:hypothetical protein [Flavobacteriales bacterium]